MGQLYLIRHGQASFGAANYDELSALGQQQAQVLGQWLAGTGVRFDRVLTGAMQRQRQTAEACLALLGDDQRPAAPWPVDAGFDEYDHVEVLVRYRPAFAEPGALVRELRGHADPKRAFQRLFEQAVARWMGGAHDDDYRESWPAFQARCAAALARVTADAGKGDTLAVFTSAGTIAGICQQVLGLGDAATAALSYTLVNSSVTRLVFRPGQVSLGTLNAYGHLEWLGKPEMITFR